MHGHAGVRHMVCGTKCHTEQSATPHTWRGPPLESVGATSRIPYRRVLAWWRHHQCTCYSDPVYDTFNNPTMVRQKHLLFGHSLVQIMVLVCHVRIGSARVRAPVWTVSGMRHWKRLIKIPGGTDCYCCINNMSCLIHVYYCFVVLVTVPDHLSAIMLHVYFVTLPGTCYTFCGGILLMYMYILPCIFCFLYTLQTSFLYIHNTVLHMPICMFTSIPSPLYNIFIIYKTRDYCGHDPMITC